MIKGHPKLAKRTSLIDALVVDAEAKMRTRQRLGRRFRRSDYALKSQIMERASMGNTNVTLPDGQSTATTDQVDEKIAAQILAGPPVNVDVPYAVQHGEQITCTMGNWEGEPRDYHYEWHRDGEEAVFADGSVATLTADDIGHVFACVVIASHSGGSTVVTSNDVIATDPAAPA